MLYSGRDRVKARTDSDGICEVGSLRKCRLLACWEPTGLSQRLFRLHPIGQLDATAIIFKSRDACVTICIAVWLG